MHIFNLSSISCTISLVSCVIYIIFVFLIFKFADFYLLVSLELSVLVVVYIQEILVRLVVESSFRCLPNKVV